MRAREERPAGHAEEHHGDGGDRVRLEQVGRHARTVADVVADVVRDHGRVARVVLGDSRLDLPDEVGADVRSLGVDAAAEPREDGDERAAESETDEVVDRGGRCVVQPVGERPVVAGDAEQSEEGALRVQAEVIIPLRTAWTTTALRRTTQRRVSGDGNSVSRLETSAGAPPGTRESAGTISVISKSSSMTVNLSAST